MVVFKKKTMAGSSRITSADLLAWSIINRETEKEDRTEPTGPHEPIDPKWIDVILGKPDAARMRGLSCCRKLSTRLS
jgi:hypothetical protein